MQALLYQKIKYALQLGKIGGVGFLFKEIKRRIYRKETFVCFEKYLSEEIVPMKSKLDYRLMFATPADMQEVLSNIKPEGHEFYFDILQRVWFYELGFKNCYIARDATNNEICFIHWTISLRDENRESREFKMSFPFLRDDELQVEHSYTFKKYRGNNLFSSIMSKVFSSARDQGYKRIITYVISDNYPSIRACEKAGFRIYETISRTKSIFSTQISRTLEPSVLPGTKDSNSF